MSTAEPRHARRAGRTLVVSFAAVALAAFVDDPWWAIAWCLLAVHAAGRLTGLARAGARPSVPRSSPTLPTRSPTTIVSLGALGYLIGLPATWRALHALADLGIDPSSVWGWALLLCGTSAFAIGYRVGAGPSRARGG